MGQTGHSMIRPQLVDSSLITEKDHCPISYHSLCRTHRIKCREEFKKVFRGRNPLKLH
jgi:hypothetical protein